MKNNNYYIFGITLVATLGGLLFGYDTAVISGTVESLRKFFIEPFGLPLDQANALEGFVVSSALIGCILGASFAGWISQRYGRKPTLVLAAILFLLSAIGSAWPELFVGMPGSGDHTYMYLFVFYRIVGGVGVGLASMVSPMYIAEMAPAEKRGNLVSWNQFAIIFGMLVVYFVNYSIALQGDAALLQQIVVGAVNLSFTVLAIFTVDRFGRRPLMIIGALVMAVSMMVLGTTFYTHSVGIGSLVCMLVYTAGFAMSWGPVCWVLLAEIFPNTIRSTVMSIAVAGQWIANFLVSWTFPMLDKSQYLTDTFNHGMAYWVYGIMGILAALFIWKFVPETKGKTLEQMEQYWK